jgi:hypothetical protein
MAKQQPPNTKGHTLFLPNELHRKIKVLTKYGTADDLIIECVEEGISLRWKDWIAQEYAKVAEGTHDENRQGTVRRSSPPDATKASAESLRHTRKERT